MTRKKSGLALLVVVGVLGLLAVLAAAFVTMAQLERRASRQRLYATKARLLARSGIEDALARLSAGQDPSDPANVYGGEAWDATPGLSPFEALQEIFQPGMENVGDCPVRHAMRPSFFVRSLPSTNPALQAVEGRLRGLSGALEGVSDRHVYGVKVEDESAKINVNGGFLDIHDRDGDGVPDHRDPDVRPPMAPVQDTGHGWNKQLMRILNILGAHPEVAIPNLGDMVIQNRPEGGYPGVAALQQAIGTSKDLSPFLTVSSWIDTKVVHPNAYATQMLNAGAPYIQIKNTRLPLKLEEYGRPPVNLNAAPRPVLVALIQGLEGMDWQDEGFPQQRGIPPPAVPAMPAQIADRLIQRRQLDPFDTWGEFASFCDTLVSDILVGLNTGMIGGGNLDGADILKSNFDPNTRLNKQLPDQLIFRWVDKSDLTVWSTEGNLGPTGSFRISCVGRITGASGALLAERSLGLVTEAFRPLRHTSQKDFVGDRTLLLDYLSKAGPAYRTTGASTTSPLWWGPSPPPPGTGLAVMTYPCCPSALPGEAAAFDGSIGLATIEMDPLPPTGGVALTFLHHFDDGWDADVGDEPGLQMGPGNSTTSLQADLMQSVWPGTAGIQPSTLYPDGMHAQMGRSPAFQAPPNFPPVRPPVPPLQGPTNYGAMGFWVKPLKKGGGPNRYLFSCVRHVGGPQTQVMLVGHTCLDKWGIQLENQANNPDNDVFPHCEIDRMVWESEGAPMTCTVRYPGLRWQFLTAFWDTSWGPPPPSVLRNLLGYDADVSVKSLAQETPPLSSASSYDYHFALQKPLSEDLTPAGSLFVLGASGALISGGSPNYANDLIDEFAVYDFGQNPAVAKAASDAWAQTRYQDGRYYKGEDGTFTSVPIEPDPGRKSRLLNVRWTAYVPQEKRMEIRKPVNDLLPSNGTPRLLDSRLDRASVTVSLLKPLLVPMPIPLNGRVDERLQSFRYQVLLKTGIPMPVALSTPALETPFLDDITFFWQPESGPRIRDWGCADL
jgi:hypothetical protein